MRLLQKGIPGAGQARESAERKRVENYIDS